MTSVTLDDLAAMITGDDPYGYHIAGDWLEDNGLPSFAQLVRISTDERERQLLAAMIRERQTFRAPGDGTGLLAEAAREWSAYIDSTKRSPYALLEFARDLRRRLKKQTITTDN